MRARLPLLLLAFLAGACRAPEAALKDECPCAASSDPRNAGAVIVRWRVEDARVGRLFGRGQCCCAPQEIDPASPAAGACLASGPQCPESPAWLIDQVRLRVRPLSDGAGVGGAGTQCFISSPCSAAELATDFCLGAGDYELQLVAAVASLGPATGAETIFMASGGQARSAPAVRRTVRPGQTVNLDAVLLGVNEPPPAPDM